MARKQKKSKHIHRAKIDTKNLIDRRDAPGVMFRPSTLDETTRSIEVVAATEAPSMVYDPQRYEAVEEIILMSGAIFPDKVPLTVEHERYAGSVIGSLRDIRIENGEMIGRVHFSTSDDSEPFYTKTKEQHLDSFSVTYSDRESVWIDDGASATVAGKVYEGPLLVTKKWKLRSLGLVIYGADEKAKARAKTEKKPEKEIEKMDPKLRAFLERSGLKKDATEAEALAFLDTLEMKRSEPEPKKKEPEQKIDVDAMVERAKIDENARITEIGAMCERHEYPADEAKKLVSDPKTTVEMARKAVLIHLEKTKIDPDTKELDSFEVLTSEKEKFRSAAEDSLIMRSSINVKIEKPAPGANELMGFSQVEIARHCLRIAGQSQGGNKLEMVGRAMTTSDFPYILANTANKSLQQGWETEPETWQAWCATGSVSDFKTQTAVNPSEFSDLEEVPEDTEFKYGDRTEAREQYKIATYGKLASISRQAVINDDLDAITSNFMGMGESAARKVADLPYAVLTGNADMGDGVALFHADHSNLIASGAGAAITTATMNDLILAMGTQEDLKGLRKLNITPEFILMPKAMQGAAEVFFQSTAFSDNSTEATDSTFASTRANIHSGNKFKRIYEARLDTALATGWYAAARKGKTVKVFFLNGVQTPFMEMQTGFTVDGTTYKVRIDAGAKALDYRGLYYNYGA